MNKKMVTTLAAMSVLGATTAFAVNPFSDVTPNDWAYQAVAQLAAEGVIDGYPDGTFKGERNITRYEMAQMIARAMARQEMVDAEQQAQINRLANEFANELNSLGVRVDNLEKKVGNVRVSGDARMRVRKQANPPSRRMRISSSPTAPYYKGMPMKDVFDARIRLKFDGQVAKNTHAVARLEGGFEFGQDESSNVELETLYVEHNFTDVFAVRGGRYDVTLGATGVFYDDKLDGASVMFGDQFELEAGYGHFKAMEKTNDEVPEGWYVQAGAEFSGVNLKAFYVGNINLPYWFDSGKAKFWGVGLATDLAGVNLHGDYVRNTEEDDDNTLWTAGLSVGNLDKAKVGSFEIGADYVHQERYAYAGGSTLALGGEYMKWRNYGAKFWLGHVSFVPFENTKLNAYYTFNAKEEDDYKLENLYRVDLNYYF